MAVFLTILFVIVLLVLLYLLSLRCRWNYSKLRPFTRHAYAHRGLHGNGAPENSLLAFRRAAAAGFGAELDVHLSKDGRLIVMHDENLTRMVGRDADICDLTSRELETMRLSGSSEPIPYLEEVLPIFERAGLPVIIELKTKGALRRKLVRTVLETLKDFPKLRFCIESFDPIAMFYVRCADKTIVRGQLSSDLVREPPENLSRPAAFALKYMLLNFLSKPDFVAYQFKYRHNLSVNLCRWLYDAQEFDWTIRNRTQAAKALREGNVIIFENFIPTSPRG